MSSSRTLASMSKTSTASRSSMLSSDDESYDASRSFRQLRRNLTSEMNMNARMMDDLKSKDEEIRGLHTELSILKDRLHDYENNPEGGGTTSRPLDKIKSLLNASTTAMAYNAVGSHLNPSLNNDDEIYIMHKIIALKNELLRSGKEMRKLRENISKLKLARSATKTDYEEPEVTQVLLSVDDCAIDGFDSSAVSKDEYKNLNDNYESLTKKLDLLLEENVKQREEIQKYISDKEKVMAHLQRSKKELKAMTEKYDNAKKGNSTLRKELTSIRKQLAILENDLLDMNNENEKLQHDYKELQTTFNDIEQGSSKSGGKQSQHEIKEKKLEIKRLKDEKKIITKELVLRENDVVNLQKELNERKQENLKINEDFQELKKANSNLTSELTMLKSQVQQVQESLGVSQKEFAVASEELKNVRAEKKKIVEKVDGKLDEKIQELKNVFKDSVRLIILSLERNGNQLDEDVSNVAISVTSSDTQSSASAVKDCVPAARQAVSELVTNAHDKKLSIDVMHLVNKLADEIFVDGSVKIDIATEMNLVTSHHSMRSSYSKGSSYLEVKKRSDVLMDALHQGLSDIKALSSQSKFQSNRSKRKHDIVDDLLQKLEDEKRISATELVSSSE